MHVHRHTHTHTREITCCLRTEKLSLPARVWYWGKTTEKYQGDFPAKSSCWFSKAGTFTHSEHFLWFWLRSLLYSDLFAPVVLLSSHLLGILAVLAPSPQTSTPFTPFSFHSVDSLQLHSSPTQKAETPPLIKNKTTETQTIPSGTEPAQINMYMHTTSNMSGWRWQGWTDAGDVAPCL